MKNQQKTKNKNSEKIREWFSLEKRNNLIIEDSFFAIN